jgi:three-Cys-motif partner protein
VPPGAKSTARKGRKAKSDFEWLRDHLAVISGWGDRVRGIAPETHHDYGYHTGLKLAGLRHAVDVFSTVAGSYSHRAGFGDLVFLDLFAGCGGNRLPSGDWLGGSPLIALNAPKRFDQIIAVESGSENCESLRRRCALWPHNGVQIIEGNCNLVVDEIVTRIDSARPLIFAVVDQEKLDVAMATLTKVSERFECTDYFVNHPFGAQRELDAAVALDRDSPKVNAFTGISLTEVLDENNGDVREAFTGQVSQVLGKKIGGSSLIRDERARPLYFLLTFTRQTRRGSAFAQGYVDLHRRLAGVRASDAALAMRFIKGREIDKDWGTTPSRDSGSG